MPDQENLTINFGLITEEAIYNQEVASLIDYISDYARQVTACSSAHGRNWKDADLIIIRQAYNRIFQMVSDFSDPEQYFPNADHTTANVLPPPVLVQPENSGALIIARQLAKIWTQMRNGVSSKMISGFHPSELELAVLPALVKLDKYIETEETRNASGIVDYFPEVNDQEPDETTPGDPDNQ